MGTADRPLDASALRDWAHAVVSDLILHIDEINRLNVFPVADSDTGVNMLFTMRAAVVEADLHANSQADAEDVARVAAALAAGALNGARGNSGVILSQILRGIAEVTATAAAASGAVLRAVDANALGAALWRGVELVVASMGGVEVPGTIVSVLRAAAGAVDQCAHEGLAGAVTAAGDAAVIALEKTPEQLDVLADAGAVDAGGRGLLVLLDALRSTICGQAPARAVYEPSPRALPTDTATQRPAPQFEVMYLLAVCDAAAADQLRDRLKELGESVAIAAAPPDSYSVHVHMLKPRKAQPLLPGIGKTTVCYQPKGVVGVISPWNYPMTLTVSDSVPALVAGNAVVLKPDSQTPYCALACAELLYRAGLPRALYAIVPGPGSVVGTAITDNCDYLMFTGSSATGSRLAEHAGRRLIGFSAELGGKNPMIVARGANLDKVAKAAPVPASRTPASCASPLSGSTSKRTSPRSSPGSSAMRCGT